MDFASFKNAANPASDIRSIGRHATVKFDRAAPSVFQASESRPPGFSKPHSLPLPSQWPSLTVAATATDLRTIRRWYIGLG
jgi:hypothetical protein